MKLTLGLLGYCETNGTSSPTKEISYRVNKFLKLLDICQSPILNEELSINIVRINEKRKIDCFTKTPCFKPRFQISKLTTEQQNCLQCSIFNTPKLHKKNLNN